MNTSPALLSFAAFFVLSTAASADVKLKAAYTTGGQTTEYSVYLTKNRQRYEYGSGATIIRQTDANRLIDIDDAAKSYVVMPLTPSAAPSRKGGVVTVTTTVVDTGERKPMFGLEARHLKTTVVTVSGPGACEAVQSRTEIDGWYVDLDYTPEADTISTPRAGCQDEYRYQSSGEAKPGYPVAYVTKTTTGPGQEPATVTMDVKELSSEPLSASLFAPPEGYSEKKDLNELAIARPKTGHLRIGIAPVADQSGHSLPSDAMTSRLRAAVTSAGLDGVALKDPANQEAVKAANCDYILYSDVAQISKSMAGQIAGRVSKLSGMLSRSKSTSTADGSQATVEFRVLAVGETTPALASSATGTNGSALNLKTAIQIASTLTPLGLMAHAYGGQGFGMFASQLLASPQAGYGSDPALHGMALFARTASTFQQTATPTTSPELTAVSAALENEVQAVAAKLKSLQIK